MIGKKSVSSVKVCRTCKHFPDWLREAPNEAVGVCGRLCMSVTPGYACKAWTDHLGTKPGRKKKGALD